MRMGGIGVWIVIVVAANLSSPLMIVAKSMPDLILVKHKGTRGGGGACGEALVRVKSLRVDA